MSCTEFFSFLFVRVNKCVNIQYRVGTTVVLSFHPKHGLIPFWLSFFKKECFYRLKNVIKMRYIE